MHEQTFRIRATHHESGQEVILEIRSTSMQQALADAESFIVRGGDSYDFDLQAVWDNNEANV